MGPQDRPRPLLATDKVERRVIIYSGGFFPSIYQNIRDRSICAEIIGYLYIGGLPHPAHSSGQTDHDKGRCAELKGCNCETLCGTGNDICDEPSCLYKRNEAEHSIYIVFVTYVSVAKLRVLNIAPCDKVVQLLCVNGK